MRTFSGMLTALLVVGGGGLFAADKKDAPRTPRQTAQTFLDAAIAGRADEAAALGQPGQSPSRAEKIKKEFGELNLKKLAVIRVYAGKDAALVMTGNAKHKDRTGPMVLTLVKKDGRWLVRDIDLETEASAQGELKRFQEKHPDAKPEPDKKSQ